MPYLRVTRTPMVRKSPLGEYLCYSFSFMLETYSPIIEIDESAEELLSFCDGTRTREEILQKLSESSGEPIEEFERDFDEFVAYMIEEGALEWREEPSYVEPLYLRNRPFSVTIDMTSACNLRCPFCSQDSGKAHPDELTLDELVPFVEQVKKLKPTPIALSGGEPLLEKEKVLYMLEELCPIPEITMSIFTNGILLTKDYAHHLYDAGLRHARVSVDGHTEQLHDSIRGKGMFKKTMKGIENLKELGIHVNVVSVISRINYQYYKEISAFIKSISDSSGMISVFPVGRAKGSELLLTAEEAFNVMEVGLEGKNLETSVVPRYKCNVGETLYINQCGDIFPCLRVRGEWVLGNLRENDLCDIYKTEKMQTLLNLSVDDVEQCKECYVRYFCGGACRGFANELNGSIYAPDTFHCGRNTIFARRILERGEENTRNLLTNLVNQTRELDKQGKVPVQQPQ